MSINQLLAILRARAILLASIFLVAVSTTIAVSLLLPKQYTASSTVVIDVKSPDPISGMVLQGMMTPTYMATQVDILGSARVAQKAIRELRLADIPTLREQWSAETNGEGDFEAWLISLIQKQLLISPSRESNVIEVSYTAADPRFAAAMANAFTKAYIETSIELRAEPARQFAALFEEQASQQRKKLESAQARLSAYQKEKGIIATDERIDVENQRLQELTAQLVAIQSISADTQSRQVQAGENSPDVIANGVVAALTADLARQEARQKELSARLGSAHPEVLESNASIRELRSKINQEIKKIGSSLAVGNRISQMREAQIKAALNQQRQKILQIKDQRDEVTSMLRDIDAAQRAYDSIMARYNQTSLESQSNQTNVAMLKRATPPTKHSSPKVIVNTLLATILGGMLAIGLTVLAEIMDRRVRDDEDLINLEGLLVVGSLPKMKTDGSAASGENIKAVGRSPLAISLSKS